MVEAFGKEIGRHLLNWSGWLFTVGGTILALWLTKEHWWILLLIVLTFAGAALTLSYRTYRKWESDETRHRAELGRLREEHQLTTDRLQETERKLNEVPSTILGELQLVIERHSFEELARELTAYADFVGRMTRFAQAFPKPLNLRAFTKQAGALYALAKVGGQATEYLRVDDPFLLMRRAANGLETVSAHLVVHQVPEAGKDFLSFRIDDYTSEEMELIAQLSQNRDVEGIKGYRVQVACDVSRYQDLDMATLATVLERLVNELTLSRRDSHD